MLQMLLHATGGDNPDGTPYLELSGFLNLIIPAIIGVTLYWWHHNCHHKRCPRIGRHKPGGTSYCKKHHPYMGLLNG